MKKLITILCLLPTISFAQNININVMGGAAYNSINRSISGGDFNKTSPFGAVSATYKVAAKNKKSLHIGVFAEAFTLSYSGQETPILNPATAQYHYFTPSYKIFNPAINFGVMAQERISVGKSDICFGLNAGLILGGKSQYNSLTIDGNLNPTEYVVKEDGYNAFTVGLHLGYAYNISSRFYVNAQLSPKYIKLNTKSLSMNDEDLSAISIPLSIGIGVKI